MAKDDVKLGFFASMQIGADVPGEFQVFPAGRITIADSDPFTVDDAAMNAVIDLFQSRGLDMVVDYEHQTEGKVEGGPDFSSPDGTAPAAGWIKSLENRGEQGLWAKVEWTDKAKEFLSAREYRYYSPVFLVSKGTRRLIELLRVALTNAPRLNWIKPIVASARITYQEVIVNKEFLVLCAKKLGLPDGSTEQEILSAIEVAKKPVEVIAKDVLDALGLAETAGKSEVVATIHAMKQKPDLTQEVATLKAKLAERERDELVAAALKDGKITPAQKDWAEKYAMDDPEGFRLFIAKAPRVVPVDGLPPLSTGGAKGVEEAQLEINKMMGIDKATWDKYNPQA